MAKTDVKKLQQAYATRNKALKTAADATERELIAKEKELQRDTSAALENAYIQNIRASHRAAQSDRAAGISGGESINRGIARENGYSGARTDLKLNRETDLASLNNQKAINRAEEQAEIAGNNLTMESQMLNISQGDDDHQRQVYAQMMSSGYIPKDGTEAQKIADLFGVPLSSLKAYVARINEKK